MLLLFVLTTSTQAVRTVSIYTTRSHRSLAQLQPCQMSTDVALHVTAHSSLHLAFPAQIIPTWNTLQPYLLSQTPSLPHMQDFKVGAFCFLEGYNILWPMDSVQASLQWNDAPMNIPNLYVLRLYRLHYSPYHFPCLKSLFSRWPEANKR